MADSPDFVQILLRLIMDIQPTFSEEQAAQIEKQIRHDYGNQQIRFAKRAPILRAEREIVRAQIGIKSLKEIEQEHQGISRRTLYRWIAKKTSKK